MRALLIAGNTVSVVYLNPKDTLGSLRKHIGCRMVASAGELAPGVVAWCDDEGKLDRPYCVHRVSWYPEELAGNIVVTGLTLTGDTTFTNMKVGDLKAMIEGTYFAHELVFKEGDKEVTTEAYGRDEASMRNAIQKEHPHIEVLSINRVNPKGNSDGSTG